MLNRVQLVHELTTHAQTLFADYTDQYEYAYRLWQQILANPEYAWALAYSNAAWPIPLWQEPLSTTYFISPYQEPYTIIGVDGSQVYPDRHQGTSCFLINIGIAHIAYNQPHIKKAVHFISKPFVFAHTGDDQSCPVQTVNMRRHEYELAHVVDYVQAVHSEVPKIVLFDGSLLFWHLESYSHEEKKTYIEHYCSFLLKLYEQGVLFAGYISMPNNKELTNILRAYACGGQYDDLSPAQALSRVRDTGLLKYHISLYQRTVLLRSRVSLAQYYPEMLAVYVFYINVGAEIVRVEVPAFIANNADMLQQVSSIILDQVYKGKGYPVILAEAHEQAVIKGPDRDFFYQAIYQINKNQGRIIMHSQKNNKKQGLTI